MATRGGRGRSGVQTLVAFAFDRPPAPAEIAESAARVQQWYAPLWPETHRLTGCLAAGSDCCCGMPKNRRAVGRPGRWCALERWPVCTHRSAPDSPLGRRRRRRTRRRWCSACGSARPSLVGARLVSREHDRGLIERDGVRAGAALARTTAGWGLGSLGAGLALGIALAVPAQGALLLSHDAHYSPRPGPGDDPRRYRRPRRR